ncbi:hypothetical protein Ciccas_012905 [Cichlidogyrus casuarinus]|uniref:Serpin domain-containing protein n=1 Tax=Cichlidogyrus casuarinus TaxID=1844966 RepID=A0ABD2PQ38_9PLAT
MFGDKENVILGPASIYMAALMLVNGSATETRNQLLRALKIDEKLSNDAVNKALNDCFMEEFYRDNEEENAAKLVCANKVLVSVKYPISKKYLELLQERFKSTSQIVDFESKAIEISQQVNEFVSQTTNGKISKVCEPDDFSSDTVIFLMNAVYFKGFWRYQFSPDKTIESNFHRINDAPKKIQMMHSDRQIRMEAKDDDPDFSAIQMDFRDSQMSMILILPKRSDGLMELQKRLFHEPDSIKAFRNAISNFHTFLVDIMLPKFKLESELDVKNVFQTMGVVDAFSRSADLSLMHQDEAKALYVSQMKHKAFLKIDEYGAEAAAYTACNICPMSLPPSMEFKADHPFLVVLLSSKNEPLFIGQVLDP